MRKSSNDETKCDLACRIIRVALSPCSKPPRRRRRRRSDRFANFLHDAPLVSHVAVGVVARSIRNKSQFYWMIFARD